MGRFSSGTSPWRAEVPEGGPGLGAPLDGDGHLEGPDEGGHEEQGPDAPGSPPRRPARAARLCLLRLDPQRLASVPLLGPACPQPLGAGTVSSSDNSRSGRG